MVSLSTVYSLSIVLGSIAGMAAAFVGTKVYPIQSGGGDIQTDIQEVVENVKEQLTPAPEPLAVETTTPVTIEPPITEQAIEPLPEQNIEQTAEVTV